jgi:hypothetical protein
MCTRAEVAQSEQRLCYGLDDRCSIPGNGSDAILPLRHRIQTGSGAHLASNPVGASGFYTGGKATGA